MKSKGGKTLPFGTDLDLPLKVATEKVAILGQSDGGKTYAAMLLVELLLANGVQVIVRDPVGVWWGLRYSADGKHPGFQVLVLGGRNGSLPLSPNAGKATARLLVERRLSAVIDVSEMDQIAQAKFMRDFESEFFELMKRHPHPVHCVYEEAQEFIPEDPEGKEEVAMRGAIIRLMKVGRNYGVGWTIVSQEPQAVSKRALSQVGTMIAKRTMGDYAQRVFVGWAQAHLRDKAAREELLAQLPTMDKTQGYIASPYFLGTSRLFTVAKKTTFDSSRTPEVGEGTVAPPKVLADAEVEKIRAEFAGLVEQLEAEDPEALKRRVRQLEQEVAQAQRVAKATAEKPTAPAADPKIEQQLRQARAALEDAVKFIVKIEAQDFFKAGVPEADRTTIQRAIETAVGKALNEVEAKVTAELGSARKLQAEATALKDHLQRLASMEVPVNLVVRHQQPLVISGAARPRAPAPAATTPAKTHAGEVQIKAGARRILQALAMFPGPQPRGKVGMISGLSPSTGTFSDYLGALRRAGLMTDAANGELEITSAGLSFVGPISVPTGAELIQLWAPKLKGGARRMLDILVARYPGWVARADLGAQAGLSPSTGTFSDYLGALRRAQLIEDGAGGAVRASQNLFLGAAA
jgi:hypothetical protein